MLPLWLPLELPPSLPLPPSTLPDLPLPLLPPLPEDTLLLDVMSPTLLELSMLPRGRLRLRLMLRLTPTFSTVDSDTLDTPDTDMLVSPTPDTLVWDTTTVLDTLTTPDRLPFLPLDPLTSLVLPLLLLPLWSEDTLLLDVTVPTLLVLSTVPKKSAHTTCFC